MAPRNTRLKLPPAMWTCSKCGEQHDDQFDSCWKCAGVPWPTPEPLRCLRCPTNLDYVGTKKFHEGARWGVLGDIGELFTNRESFDVYVCPRCGRVELFVDGVGEALRPGTSSPDTGA